MPQSLTPNRKSTPQISIRDTRELRGFLVSQMEGIANGMVAPETAKGVANLAQQVYNTLNIEIKHAVIMQKLGTETEIKKIKFDD